MTPTSANRGVTINRRLIFVALVTAIPLFLLSAITVWHLGQRERGTRRDAIVYASHAIVTAVDAQLSRYLTLAETLSGSPSLQSGDFRAFLDQARKATARLSAAWVILTDGRGQQLVDTALPADASLPPVRSQALADAIAGLDTGRVQIIDTFNGRHQGSAAVGMGVPVLRADAPGYFLVLGIATSVFSDLLNSHRIPDGWHAALLDRSGNVIARSNDQPDSARKEASFQRHAILKQDGWFEGVLIDGELTTFANAPSALSGWTVEVGAPDSVFETPVRRTILLAGLAGLLATAMSAVLATWAARRISRPIHTLEMSANALRRYQPVAFAHTGVSEIDQLLRTLSTLSAQLTAREDEHLRGEQLLKGSEARWRAVVDTAISAIIVIDESARIQSFNPAAERIFGYRAEEVVGRNVSLLMPEPDRSAHDGHIETYRRTGRATVIGRGREITALRRDGTEFPADLSVAEWHSEGRRFFTGILRDITDRKKAEGHTRMIMQELSHRTKNLLAVIQVMTWQTSWMKLDPQEFAERFMCRIDALVRSHDLLTKGEWHGVDLEEIVRDQLAPFVDGRTGCLVLTGPPVHLSPEAAQTLGLALHELGTNATKHGALSSPAGRIRVEWELNPDANVQRRFRMNWQERDGPVVSCPKSNGFGYTIIKDVMEKGFDAEVSLDFASEGFRWCLCASTDRLLGHDRI